MSFSKNFSTDFYLRRSLQVKECSVLFLGSLKWKLNIDLLFFRYLKSHCAVSEVYFALDPDTGIASHPQHDPWRWAQDVSDRIGTSDESFVVFLAAPPPAMGLTIYKDLQNNQAFVAAKYLKNMVRESLHY